MCVIMIPHKRARCSRKSMPKRGIDADGRVFFDELVSLDAARLKATGAIRLEDRHGVIAFGDEDHGGERRKCIGVAHTNFPNGGSWSYFICPRCGGRKKKLWLVDDAPRCLSCCWSLGVRYRSAYGFGRSPLAFCGSKGRHPSSCNDFNSQRHETPRIATLSQQLFSDAGIGKWDPGKFLGEPRPPTLVCMGGGGDGERSRGLKLYYNNIVYHTRMTAS